MRLVILLRIRSLYQAFAMIAWIGVLPPLSAAQEQPPRPGDGGSVMLRPGDKVRLKVWREPDLSGEFAIDEDGIVVFPKLGRFDVQKMSSDSLKALLIARYAESLRSPSVEVTVLRKLNILGAVRNPGLYYVDPTTTVADALALAGGVSSDGKQNGVELLRDGKRVPVELTHGSRLADSPLQSGDQLRVPQRSWLSRNTALVAAALSSVAIIFAASIR